VSKVWAAVPVKEFTGAKQRLAGLLSPAQREALAAAMLEDVLAALARAPGLAGVMVNTVETRAKLMAQRYGARVVSDGARDGHTGAVAAMGRILAKEGTAMLALPGDIPGVSAAEIDRVASSCLPAPSFTIVPAHDALGSNAVLCNPPDAVALRFGDNSYFPHLAAARCQGTKPTILRLRGFALGINHLADLRMFLQMAPRRITRTLGLLEQYGL